MKTVLCWALVGAIAACDSGTSTSASDGTSTTAPNPSLGNLIIRVDTTPLVVGRTLHVEIDGVDPSGAPFDVGPAEITSTNTSVAQLISNVAFPITFPPSPVIYSLSVTFGLTAPGSTAIRARIGLLSDSVVIAVVAAPSTSVSAVR